MFVEGEKQIEDKKQDSKLIPAYYKHFQGKTDLLFIGTLTNLCYCYI